jgi:hydrogenase nickel incorporation protein HypA/HybF
MHELSIALGILDAAGEEMANHDGACLRAIHVRLGPLSGVVGTALQSAYALAREGSGFDQADLVVEEIPLIAYCDTCAAERELASPALLCCPVCGNATPAIIKGRELELVALEIE